MMKKARITLSVVAVFAVIGGAFAFKASRNAEPLFKRTTLPNGAIVCTVPFVTSYTTRDQGLGQVADLPYSTQSTLAVCITTLFRTLEL